MRAIVFGGNISGEHVAPGNRHGAARFAVAQKLAAFPRQRHRRQFAVDARTTTATHAFHAGLGRARTRAAAGFERQNEMSGIGQAALELRGDAIGRHHVETGARQHDDAG